MRTHTVVAAGAAALSMVLLGACGGDDGSGGSARNDTGGSASPDDDAVTSGPHVGSGAKVAIKAMDTAAADVDDGAVMELGLDDDGGTRLWEVTVASGAETEYELRVSADGTEVESNNEDTDLDDDIARLGDVELSAPDAAKRAAKDHPGDVTAVDFESEGDTLTWQVTLTDDGSVTEHRLDADTGETLGSEPED